MEEITLNIDREDRLDIFLADKLQFTRSHVKKIIEDGLVTVNDEIIKKGGFKIKDGTVSVIIEDPEVISADPEDIPIDIIYQDKDIAVINKQQGLVTHPCEGTKNGTLVNAIMFHIKDLSAINGVLRPGIVHRLDKDTSGLIVIAKNNEAHISLADQIQTKVCGRYYLALVAGNIKEDKGVIDLPIGRNKKDRKKMAVDADGRRAVTEYKVKERFGDYTLVEFKLRTGRTHQIRVHSSYKKHPIVGDKLYGGDDKFKLNGQLLHAYKLELIQPTTKEKMVFTCDLPDYFENVLEKLRKRNN
ncbi:MAG: RluA family pseudouridine synthase [Clostridia bacterium]|nr:RluA family pseudouridine synthase [Clostridia bacterium]